MHNLIVHIILIIRIFVDSWKFYLRGIIIILLKKIDWILNLCTILKSTSSVIVGVATAEIAVVVWRAKRVLTRVLDRNHCIAAHDTSDYVAILTHKKYE